MQISSAAVGAAVFHLIFAVGLTMLLAELLRPPRDERPAVLRWASWALLFVLCARTLDWLTPRAVFGANELPPSLPLSTTGDGWLFCIAAGAVAFGSLGGARNWAKGALCGALFSALGYCGYRWLIIAAAWRLLGSFSGTFILYTMPFWLSVACAVVATALLQRDFAVYRWRIIGLMLLAWYGGAIGAHRRLETGFDFGPRSLAAAAGLSSSESPAQIAVVRLDPSNAVYELKPAQVDGVDVNQKNLVRLYDYLEAKKFRTIFLKQALKVLRQGWLFWWDPERALKAATLSSPGRVVPDYRLALGLLKAGPQSRDRYDALRALSSAAKDRKAGFEDVTGSQYIFEGFSAAYARFGEEEMARWWLIKIDNLWPIYEKRIEVTPVEQMHDGAVTGTVMISSAPANGMLVGLFYVGTSTAPETWRSSGTLSDSMLADAQGRFGFGQLGPGHYYLGLMGSPDDLRGRVHDEPGVFELSADTRAAHFAPILIDR
jgi:hypothetical protein